MGRAEKVLWGDWPPCPGEGLSDDLRQEFTLSARLIQSYKEARILILILLMRKLRIREVL